MQYPSSAPVFYTPPCVGEKGISMTEIKYPQINVQLVGLDGNAFSILGRVQKAAKRAGLDKAEIEEYMDEATKGDYNHLLSTTMAYFSTEGGDAEADAEWDEHWAEMDAEDDDDEV